MRVLLLLLLFAAGLAACGERGEPQADRPSPAPARPSATPTRAPSPLAAPVRTTRAQPRVEVLARRLEVPWDIAFLPDGRALLTERPGRVRLLSARGRLKQAPVARVPVAAQGEGGLLGIAVDPDFARGKRFVYLYVTRGGVRVERWRWTGSRLRRSGTVLTGIRAGSIHDSGRLRFGPDRRLYVTTGDAGQGALAQDRASLNGKVLRLSPAQYRSRARRPEVYALGLRNPQGLDWQPGSGRLWADDHGPSGFDGPSRDDELNVIRAGANYGWPRVRGRDHGAYAAPAWLWTPTQAPSGLAFVSRGGSTWSGHLLVAALKGTSLHRLEVRGRRVVRDSRLLAGRYGRLRAVVEAPDGTIWVTTSNRDTYGSPVSADDDRVLRVIPPAA